MSNKPEGGWLVELWDDGAFEREDAECADAELRRLRAVNQELLEALERIAAADPTHTHFATLAISEARAAIAKATGESA